MNDPIIRTAEKRDRSAIRLVEERAFGQAGEADLVERLVANDDVVLELVAEVGGAVVGHVLFSRLLVASGESASFPAVALAPLAVEPDHQRKGIGAALVEAAHAILIQRGERLSVVLGEPFTYGRFGYAHERAAAFESDYQCEALQALAWGEAPVAGKLVYPSAFMGL